MYDITSFSLSPWLIALRPPDPSGDEILMCLIRHCLATLGAKQRLLELCFMTFGSILAVLLGPWIQ